MIASPHGVRASQRATKIFMNFLMPARCPHRAP